MLHHFKGKDNALLVEFESVINLDLAMYKYAKSKYKNSSILNSELFNSNITDTQIKTALLQRRHINPFEIFLPSKDPQVLAELYFKIIKDDELLQYAETFDLFKLMITFLEQASSIHIDILCENELQSKFIHSLSNRLNTVIYSSKEAIPMDEYSVLYIKYLMSIALYPQPVICKNIYTHMAGYNILEETNTLDPRIIRAYTPLNNINTIDPYVDIKYFTKSMISSRKDDINDRSSNGN